MNWRDVLLNSKQIAFLRGLAKLDEGYHYPPDIVEGGHVSTGLFLEKAGLVNATQGIAKGNYLFSITNNGRMWIGNFDRARRSA